MQQSTKISPYYESVEFTLTDGQSDYNLDTQQADFLAVFNTGSVNYPSQVKIRTDQTITVKLNSTSNDSITIASTDSPLDIRGIEIRNIFLSNSSGSSAAVKLLFQDVEY